MVSREVSPTKTREDRASCTILVCHLHATYKDKGGQSVLKILVRHLQRQRKAERPGKSWFSILKDYGRQSVLEILSLPPTKTREGRASWKFLVCHLQRRGKIECPGRFWFATEKKTGAVRKGSSGLTTKKGKPRRNMILKGLRSATDRKRPWEYLGMSKVAIFKRGSVYRDSSIPLLALPRRCFACLEIVSTVTL